MDIVVYDKSFSPVGIIDAFDSIIWTDKYTDVGVFELYAKMNDKNVLLLQKDYILSIKETDQTMIIDTIKLESDIENGDKLIVTGRSITSILDRRIVWNQTNLSGNFQDAIERLLNENAITPTELDREIPNLVFLASTDPLVTASTINEQYYGDNLLAVIQSLCLARDIGFKILFDTSDGTLTFSLYAGTDRSFQQITNPHVIFSPKFDNLMASDYLESLKGSVTVTLVGGEGEGTDQKTLIVDSPYGAQSGLDRRESYTDATDVSSTIDGGTLTEEEYNDALQSRGEISLAESSPIAEFGATVESTVAGYMYGRDFFLGDIVQAENEYGIAGPMRVTEFVISEDASGYKVYPTFEMI